MSYKKGFVKISEDYIVLSAVDSSEWLNADSGGDVPIMSWEIPVGAYSSIDVRHPMITELEVVAGQAHIGKKTMVVRYHNGVINQYTTSDYPVIAYANTRASNSAVVLGNGNFIVYPKPSKIALGIISGDGATYTKGEIDGLNVTLKYCYYEPQ